MGRWHLINFGLLFLAAFLCKLISKEDDGIVGTLWYILFYVCCFGAGGCFAPLIIAYQEQRRFYNDQEEWG